MWKDAEDFLSNDSVIGPLVKKYGSCRIKKRVKTYYFNDIASSIIEQQLSGKAATAIYERVKQAVGVGDKLLTPDSILKCKDDKLRNAGISWAKVKYLKDLSEKVLSGEVEIHKMDKLSDEEIVEELTKVKGIGRWTAEMFLMFSLARPDVFPVGDSGIKNGLRILFDNKQLTRTLGNNGSSWKPFRTVASWYIWKSLDND